MKRSHTMINLMYNWVVLLAVVSIVHCQTYTNMDTLLTDLLTGYNKKVRPVNDQSQSITVNVRFSPGAIVEFETVKEVLRMTAVIDMSWQDEKIVWTPSSYGNIDSVQLPQTDIWYPPLILADPADELVTIGKSSSVLVIYNSTGYATYSAGNMVEVMCALIVTYWPLDRQKCDVRLAPQNYYEQHITLVPQAVGFEYYTENGEWEITSTSSTSYVVGIFPVVSFTFELKRRPTFLIVNIILPIIFLMTLSVFVFFLPAASGERVGYSITVLLAIAVFFGVVNEFLPHTSKSMSNLTYYLMINFITSTCICLGTMVSLRLHFKQDREPLPKWLMFLCHCCSRKRAVSPVDSDEGMVFSRQKTESDDLKQQVDEEASVTWTKIANIVDIIQCVAFAMVVVGSTMWVLLTMVIHS